MVIAKVWRKRKKMRIILFFKIIINIVTDEEEMRIILFFKTIIHIIMVKTRHCFVNKIS